MAFEVKFPALTATGAVIVGFGIDFTTGLVANGFVGIAFLIGLRNSTFRAFGGATFTRAATFGTGFDDFTGRVTFFIVGPLPQNSAIHGEIVDPESVAVDRFASTIRQGYRPLGG
jgi:hypothetical protein